MPYKIMNFWNHRSLFAYVNWPVVGKIPTIHQDTLWATELYTQVTFWSVPYNTGASIYVTPAISNNVKDFYEYDSNVVAIVKFRGGAIGKTSTLFDAEMPYTFNIDLVGTEGALRDNRLWSKRLLPGQTDWAALPTILPDSGDVHHHPFDAEVDHLVECIRTDRESHCNIADAFHTHELCLAIDRSIEQGGAKVSLPLSL